MGKSYTLTGNEQRDNAALNKLVRDARREIPVTGTSKDLNKAIRAALTSGEMPSELDTKRKAAATALDALLEETNKAHE